MFWSVPAAATDGKLYTLSAILHENHVKNKELQRKFEGDFSELRKIINSWNLIPGSSNNEFDNLNHKILDQLNKNSEFDKMERILESELIITYGLYRNEFNSERLTEEIISWWNSKIY